MALLLALHAPTVAQSPEGAPSLRARRFLRGRGNRPGLLAAQALEAARRQHRALLAEPRVTYLSTSWTPVGPASVSSPVYGKLTGRVTAIVVDPDDTTGNTVYVGTTGGGVWKSTNALAAASAVAFAPLTDTLPVFSLSAGSSVTPSLSIGSLAIGGDVLLAGTGDPNDATDSYYGAGILRSTDGGLTWTLAQGSQDGSNGNHSFVGLSVAGIAFSSLNSNLVVAALSEAVEGEIVNAGSTGAAVKGLYVSQDAGQTWQMATILDGNQAVQAPEPPGGNGGGNAATAVVWNPVRQRFYAAVRYHGYYESVDGLTWTRLANQPGSGLTLSACPTNPGLAGSAGCPLLRGALAVQTASGDLFALTVDDADQDQGLYQDACAMNSSGACANATVLFGNQLASSRLEVGSGSTVIPQADYDLALAAAASGTDTLLYIGTVDLYRCSLASGCVLRNTTNALNGCANPAGVFSAQHALALGLGASLLLGNDGGVWRSLDGAAESGTPCSAGDASHFDNLNGGIGSLAEVVSFAEDPVAPGTLLAGLGALGSAGTDAADIAGSSWPQMGAGEGGTVAIDPNTPQNWYVSTGPGVNIGRCSLGAACTPADFTTPVIGSAQVNDDPALTDAPWLLDSQATDQMVVGTCRVWRGPAVGGSAWSGGDLLSEPFAAPGASACSPSSTEVRSLGLSGPVAPSASPNDGSEVLYAGMAGLLDSGTGVAGHVFTTSAANTANSNTPWTDAALAPVTNAQSDAYVFNPGQFDISSIVADPHDASGATVYATVMGFAGNGVNAPHLYQSTDFGAHWLNLSANLPNAPANSVVVDPNDANTVYVALDTGVYITRAVATCPSANCWSVYGSALPNAPVTALAAAPAMPTGDGRTGELRASTYGRGIWQIPLVTALSPLAASITLTPGALSFAAQQVGTESAPVTITVTNTGNATLTVTNVATNGDFVETDACVGVPVAPGASCSIAISFAPASAGMRNGLLTVYGNIAGGQATASLTGTGTAAAAVVLTPVTLNFPSTNVGSTSFAENITVSNTGSATVNLQSVQVSGDFTISANSCGTSLAPETGCTVSLVFAPTASGARFGSLTVTDDAGTQTAALSGSGTNPATDGLSPLSLSFAAQQIGTVSAPQQVTLTNTGGVALTLVAAETSGDFTVVNQCGASLAANASCVLSVQFVPKNVGAESGVLTISDEYRSQMISLHGTGLAPPGVSLSPAGGLTFAATGVGQSSTPQGITLTNNGGVPLVLGSATLTGDFALAGSTCGVALPVGASCSISISFVPSAGGPRSGLFAFTDSAPGSPQQLPLAGAGIDFSLTADGPQSLTVTSGQPAAYLLLLRSSAGVSGTATFTCSGVPIAAACQVSPAMAALGDSGGTVVTVTVGTGVIVASAQPSPRIRPWFAALLLFAPVCFLARRRPVALTFFCAVLGCVLIGCSSAARTIPDSGAAGSGGGGVSTPSGQYTITVAGASAGLVRAVNLTLIVQ